MGMPQDSRIEQKGPSKSVSTVSDVKRFLHSHFNHVSGIALPYQKFRPLGQSAQFSHKSIAASGEGDNLSSIIKSVIDEQLKGSGVQEKWRFFNTASQVSFGLAGALQRCGQIPRQISGSHKMSESIEIMAFAKGGKTYLQDVHLSLKMDLSRLLPHKGWTTLNGSITGTGASDCQNHHLVAVENELRNASGSHTVTAIMSSSSLFGKSWGVGCSHRLSPSSSIFLRHSNCYGHKQQLIMQLVHHVSGQLSVSPVVSFDSDRQVQGGFTCRFNNSLQGKSVEKYELKMICNKDGAFSVNFSGTLGSYDEQPGPTDVHF